MTLQQLYDNKKPWLFFIRFLFCFFILYFFFYFYWGITGIGGKIYSPLVADHFNLIKGFTRFLTGAAKFCLDAIKYNVYRKNYSSLRIGNSGVNVNPSCLGWGVMSFWVAFVYADNADWKQQLVWMFSGVVSICMLNIIRIILIMLALHLHWKKITFLDYHHIFNILSYGCIFILIYGYTVFKKPQRIKYK